MRRTTIEQVFPKRERLSDLLARFARARVAVVGDYFLDRYLVVDPSLAEPSLETGLPAHQVVEVRNSPGAAGTVVNNLTALGVGAVAAVGVVGDDGHGFELRRQLERRGVETACLVSDGRRLTPTYLKPVLRGHQGEVEQSRFDFINRTPTPGDLHRRTLESIAALALRVDAVVLLDQVGEPDCGVIAEPVRRGAAELATQHPETLFYADSRSSIGLFRGVAIKANHHEALRAADISDCGPPSDEAILEAGSVLFERTGKPVLVTLGPRGILVTDKTGQTLAPGFAVSGPLDVTGAGDSATAGTVLSLCAGASLIEAACVGNLVASLTVQILGDTGVATPEEVRKRCDEAVGGSNQRRREARSQPGGLAEKETDP